MFFKHIPHVISTFLRKFATKNTSQAIQHECELYAKGLQRWG